MNAIFRWLTLSLATAAVAAGLYLGYQWVQVERVREDRISRQAEETRQAGAQIAQEATRAAQERRDRAAAEAELQAAVKKLGYEMNRRFTGDKQAEFFWLQGQLKKWERDSNGQIVNPYQYYLMRHVFIDVLLDEALGLDVDALKVLGEIPPD